MNAQDREFWKGYNRRKHAYFMDHKAEQRERFREECEALASRPEPKKITGKVLEIKR